MTDTKLLEDLQAILALNAARTVEAQRAAATIREAGAYRWVGIYDVNAQAGEVSNVAWSGPGAPMHPVFPITQGLTSRAIAERATVNEGDVANNASYLTALGSTRSEIIVPVLDETGDHVVGTIDVESEYLNAFDTEAQMLLEECAKRLAKFWN